MKPTYCGIEELDCTTSPSQLAAATHKLCLLPAQAERLEFFSSVSSAKVGPRLTSTWVMVGRGL